MVASTQQDGFNFREGLRWLEPRTTWMYRPLRAWRQDEQDLITYFGMLYSMVVRWSSLRSLSPRRSAKLILTPQVLRIVGFASTLYTQLSPPLSYFDKDIWNGEVETYLVRCNNCRILHRCHPSTKS